MDGEMLEVREAARILWGNSDRKAYERTLRLLKNDDIKTFRDGRKIFVSRSEIEKVTGVMLEPVTFMRVVK